MRRYYEYIRENDLVLTHSLINLQRSRNVSGMFNLEEGTALQVVRETEPGIVVRGARVLATLGPLADEIAVYSPRLGQHTEGHSPFALTFAIPCGTPGLQLPLPRQLRSRPLAFRPSARLALRGDGLHRVLRRCARCRGSGCSCYGDVDLLNGTAARHALLGAFVASGRGEEPRQMRIRAGRRAADDRDARQRAPAARRGTHRRTDADNQLTRACMRAGEADAKLDEWGVMCPDPVTIESTRNLFMTAYPRMIEILQLLGSSSFMITPSEADFKGPLAADIEQYLATDTTTAARPGAGCSAWPGTWPAAPSAAARCCTSASSPATR